MFIEMVVGFIPKAAQSATYLTLEFLYTSDLDLICNRPKGGTDF